MNNRRQDHRQFRRARLNKTDLRNALEGANNLTNQLASQLVITTMVAAFRGGELSLASAAAACAMTEDNFKRAGDTVNAEARRMLANKDELDNQK